MSPIAFMSLRTMDSLPGCFCFNSVNILMLLTQSLEPYSTLELYDYSFSVLYGNIFPIRLQCQKYTALFSSLPQSSCFTPLLVYVIHSDKKAKYIQGTEFFSLALSKMSKIYTCLMSLCMCKGPMYFPSQFPH